MDNKTNPPASNLIEYYKGSDIEEKFNAYKAKVKGFTDENKELGYKTGDVINFMGGYDDDIEFISRILGFDADGWAFVLWDCYWAPIDLTKRLV